MYFVIFVVSCGLHLIANDANALPAAVQMVGARVVAVEQDVADGQRQQLEPHTKVFRQQILTQQWLLNFLITLQKVNNFEQLQKLIFQDVDEGRGMFHNRQKLRKYLYPLLLGLVIAKSVIMPLLLNLATALSSTSFVMSKIALVTSGLLALKLILAGSTSKLEVWHLPAMGKNYIGRGVGGKGGVTLHGTAVDDSSWSDSNWVGNMHRYRQKFIPIGSVAAAAMAMPAGIGGSGGFYAVGKYPQHNYDIAYDGKPFL